jgi:beta-fructofuranosidase
MDDPDGYVHGPEGSHIFGQMTVPRELSYRDGKLYQWPVREFCEYRKDRLDYDGVLLKDEARSFDGISGRSIELEIEIAPYEVGAPLYREFIMDFAKDDDHFIRLSYKPARSLITIDRSHSGQCSEITSRRSYRAAYSDGSLSLRILIDKWSAEVFVNGGEQAMSLTYYTPVEAGGITFAADGNVAMDITAYNIQK